MNHVTSFLNKINALESICTSKLGLMIAIKNASKFVRVPVCDGAFHKIIQNNNGHYSVQGVQLALIIRGLIMFIIMYRNVSFGISNVVSSTWT